MPSSTRSICANWALRAWIPPGPVGRPIIHRSISSSTSTVTSIACSRAVGWSAASRNVEVMWLLNRLSPDHKTIADFRKENGPAIKKVCTQFVELCRKMGLLAKASVVIDGSKFKAVNNRDKNFTKAKVERRRTQVEQSVARYLAQLDTADRQERSATIEPKKTRLREKLTKLKSEMAK